MLAIGVGGYNSLEKAPDDCEWRENGAVDKVKGVQQSSLKRLADASDAVEQSIKLQVKTSELSEKALRVLIDGKAAIAASRLALR